MQSLFYVMCPDIIVRSIILKNNGKVSIGVQQADSARVFNEVGITMLLVGVWQTCFHHRHKRPRLGGEVYRRETWQPLV